MQDGLWDLALNWILSMLCDKAHMQVLVPNGLFQMEPDFFRPGNILFCDKLVEAGGATITHMELD